MTFPTYEDPANRLCENCAYYVWPECRRRSPGADGWPRVGVACWCGEFRHKFSGNRYADYIWPWKIEMDSVEFSD